MSLFQKYLFKRPITAADKAEAMDYYRSLPMATLSDLLNDRRREWFETKERFSGLRPDENQRNHPQEYRMRTIEMQIQLMETVLSERTNIPESRGSEEAESISAADKDAAEGLAQFEVASPTNRVSPVAASKGDTNAASESPQPQAAPEAGQNRERIDGEGPAEVVERELQLRGWTMDDLADKAGVDKKTALKVKRGQHVHPKNFKAIADALGVDASRLLPQK